LALRAMVWATVGILWPAQKQTRQYLPSAAKPLGKSRCDIRDMPTMGPNIARSATVGELDGES
jgi:hypothetical protein